MKKLLLLLTLAVAAFAQTAPTTTTTLYKLATSDTYVYVASAAGIVPGNLLFVDKEAMLINSVSGIALGVQRSVQGTAAVPHNTGVTVYQGGPGAFLQYDPSGACSAGAGSFPVISTGNIWTCTANQWTNIAAGGTAAWGSITGTLASQADLAAALALKAALASPTFTGTVNLAALAATGNITSGTVVQSPLFSGSAWNGFVGASGAAGGVGLSVGNLISWTSSASTTTVSGGDTGIARNSAGVVDINSGTPGTGGGLFIQGLKSTTGTRYLCISTTGLVSSSASACSGT
ncbi:MAG: hypothetical protein NVSMB64_06300 [Candidatus Velthaea sp.]